MEVGKKIRGAHGSWLHRRAAASSPAPVVRPLHTKRYRRMVGILTQLPAAVRQAHERIIGERPVPNGEKILSFYDADV